MVSSPAGFTAELEWELEVQGHKDGMMTLISDGRLADRPKLGEG
jgi:hypothetical protein